MVCLTSCVFRSIRFSGFARPPHWGAARGRTIHARAGWGQALSRACTGWTQTGNTNCLGAFPARRGARTPPPCSAPSPRRSPTAPLPHTARLPCGKAGLVCLAYIVGAGSAQRTGGTRARAHRRATRYRTRRRAICHLITARLCLGQYSGLVCPQFFTRAVLPRRHRKARAPRQPGDAGSKRRVPVLICLTSLRPDGGRCWP